MNNYDTTTRINIGQDNIIFVGQNYKQPQLERLNELVTVDCH